MTEYSGGEYLGSPDDFDLKNAIGNTLAFGRAKITANCCGTYSMDYTWRIEDIFTFQKKGAFDDYGDLHEAGLARDFRVTGEFNKTFVWTKGQFNGKCT